MYIPTEEDEAAIKKDRVLVDQVVKHVERRMSGMATEHTAIPILSAIVDAALESLFDEYPPLHIFNHMTSGRLQYELQVALTTVYFVGNRFGELGYELHAMPCTGNGPNHLHDVEDIINNAPKED